MKRTVYRIASFLTSIALLFGSYILIGASSASASPNSYYVSPTGNDTNPGTLTSPFQTITKAINTAVAGDTIYVLTGTYPGFEIDKSGITLTGYNNEMPLISGGTGIKIVGASNVSIKGFEVVGATGNWTGAIYSTGGSYNLIEGNKVHDNIENGMTGILIESGSYNKVLYNDVYNNNFVGIRIYGTSTDVMPGNEIGFNVSHDNVLSGGNSDGIDIDAPISTGAYIHDNVVYGNADDGIDTWNSSNNLIVRNVAYDQNGVGDGNGFKMGGWTGSVGGGNNTVIGNVSYNNKTAGFTTNGGYGSKYYNNVAYNNGSYGFDDGWRDFSCSVSTCPSVYINNIGYDNVKGNFSAYIYTAVSHNNIWYSDDGSANVLYNYINYTSLSSFFAAKGLDDPDGGDLASIQANPQFANPATGSFTLQSLSPAIDAGDPSNPGQITAVNRVDIGAFEFQGTSPTASPTASPTPLLPTFTPTAILPTATQTASPVPPSPTYTPTSQPTLTSTAVPTQTSPTSTPTAAPTQIPPTSTPASIPETPTAQPTVQVLAQVTYDDLNSAFVYSSGWNDVSNSKAYDGSYKQTSTRNASVTLQFTGQSVGILYTGGSGFSRMDVYLDGVLVGSINEKSSKLVYQKRWSYSSQSAGAHILKLVFMGSHSTKGTLDAVIIQ